MIYHMEADSDSIEIDIDIILISSYRHIVISTATAAIPQSPYSMFLKVWTLWTLGSGCGCRAQRLDSSQQSAVSSATLGANTQSG